MNSTETGLRVRQPMPLLAPPAMNGRNHGPGHGPDEGDRGLDLREVLLILRRHWLLVALVTVLATAIATYFAYTRPLRYRSMAVVQLFDQRGSLTGTLGTPGLERAGGWRDPLLSQIEVMRSRTQMGSVVDREGLRARLLDVPPSETGVLRDVQVPATVEPDTLSLVFGPDAVELRAGRERARAAYGAPLSAGGVSLVVDRAPEEVSTARLVIASRVAAINGLLDGLETRPREGTELFELYYTAGTPHRAQQVLDAIVNQFREFSAEQAQQQSRRRRVFLEQQLLETDSVLSEAQLALSLFRRQQEVYSTREEYGSQQAGLVDLEARREELEAERQMARTLLGAVERRPSDARDLAALVSSPGIASNPVIVRLYEQLNQYQTARDSLTTGQFRSADVSPEVRRLDALITSSHARIADAVRSQMLSLDARITALDGLRARRTGQMERLPGVEVEEVRLTQQVAVTQTIADQLRAELQRARIAEAVEVGQVEVVDPASLPAGPVPQNRPLRILMGLMMGLVLGAGSALVREQMNTAVVRREDLEQLLGATSLAVVPALRQNGRRGAWSRFGRRAPQAGGHEDTLLVATNPQAPAAEAYRTLRTNLLFSRTSRFRTLVIASAGPAEGKTTTTTNLAATFAQQGMTVALVDCDLRRPRVHEVFHTAREPGLTQWLLGYCSADEAIRSTTVERLSVIPAGTLPPNPSELLGSSRMAEVLAELHARFDLVLLDTPPVLLAPDASVLAAAADGVVLVARAGVTERGAARDAVQQLAKVGGNVVGGVLNDPEGKTQHGYSTYYSYGYGYSASST